MTYGRALFPGHTQPRDVAVVSHPGELVRGDFLHYA